MMKISGSWSASGSVSQRHGSADLDPIRIHSKMSWIRNTATNPPPPSDPSLQTRLDLYNSEFALASSLVLLWNLCVRSEIWISIVIYVLAAVAGQPSGTLPPPTLIKLLQWKNSFLFLCGSCQLRKSSIGISLPPTHLFVSSLLTILTALQILYVLLQDKIHRED